MGSEERFISMLFSILSVIFSVYFAGWLMKKVISASKGVIAVSEKAKKSLGELANHDHGKDELYTQALRELRDNRTDEATWARAYMDAAGEANRAEALYIKYRVKRLNIEGSAEGAS